MIAFAEISSWFGLSLMFVMFVAVTGFFFMVFKFEWRSLVRLLFGGFLFLIIMFAGWVATSRKVALRDVHSENFSHSAHVSTEAMWEHLNRSRIVLDSNELATDEHELEESKEPKTDTPSKKETPSKQNRPAWVDLSPKQIGNVYRVAVSAGPYRDAEECHQALVPKLFDIVDQRIAQLTASDDLPNLDQLDLGLDFVLYEICHEKWVESTEASFGEMKIVHVQLEFDAAVDKRLRSAVRDYQREARITQVGGIAGLSLGGLALLFGLLKMDARTRGDYTKRLFLGVPAVIITLVLLWM